MGRAGARPVGRAAQWKDFIAELTASATDPRGSLVLTIEGTGTLWLDMVSLLPARTWKDHGLRPDLCEMLAGAASRRSCASPAAAGSRATTWRACITGRRPSATWRTGTALEHLGLLGHARPRLPRIPPAVRRPRRRTALLHQRRHVAQGKRADGPDGRVGAGRARRHRIRQRPGRLASGAALRAKNGHPAPFNLKYLEIGNENGGPAYHERWPLFHQGHQGEVSGRSSSSPTTGGGYPTDADARDHRRALLQHARVLHAAGAPVRQLRPQRAEDLRRRIRRHPRHRAPATCAAPSARRRS